MNNTISLDIDKKCICRYNNFKLCNRNINGVEFCRYHKNTKNCYIHKIFYDVFKSKNEININAITLPIADREDYLNYARKKIDDEIINRCNKSNINKCITSYFIGLLQAKLLL